jgi:hypothetical protein
LFFLAVQGAKYFHVFSGKKPENIAQAYLRIDSRQIVLSTRGRKPHKKPPYAKWLHGGNSIKKPDNGICFRCPVFSSSNF